MKQLSIQLSQCIGEVAAEVKYVKLFKNKWSMNPKQNVSFENSNIDDKSTRHNDAWSYPG